MQDSGVGGGDGKCSGRGEEKVRGLGFRDSSREDDGVMIVVEATRCIRYAEW